MTEATRQEKSARLRSKIAASARRHEKLLEYNRKMRDMAAQDPKVQLVLKFGRLTQEKIK